MTQKNQKHNKKWLFWVLLVVLFVAAGVMAYFVWKEFFGPKLNLDKENRQEVTVQEEKEKTEARDEAEEETDDSDGAEVANKKVTQYEGIDPNKSAELTGVITYAAMNGNDLTIRTSIDQYLNSGSCELTILQDGNSVYTETANIVSEASTSVCQGFDLPNFGMMGAGNYQIVIKLSADGKIGTLNEEVNL